ncbi:MAG: hypothetical protein ING33_03235 [Rhodocyclaceae bacterium]|nr:hypothetical protein [Rhodocyclaceae bacterium]
MAATVQFDAYVTLSRKIGYSVGLENLVHRVGELVKLYVGSESGVRISDWKHLVEEGFQRKSPGFEHIANFFAALGLIRLTNNELHALPRLEVLSILARHFEDNEQRFDLAMRFVLLLSLIEADGDIFLNCIAADFERELARTRIAEMVDSKWTALKQLIHNPTAQSRIWDIISIRKQATPATRAAPAKVSPFAARLAPLDSSLRAPKPEPTIRIAEVQDSYLDKVLPTRKGWARDLGLIDADGTLTALGRSLLENLDTCGLRAECGCYRFWSYPHELNVVRLTYEELCSRRVDEWTVSTAAYQSLGGAVLQPDAEFDESELIEYMRDWYALYRTADLVRGAIRHQIPIYVIRPVLQGVYLAEGWKIPDFPAFVQREIAGRVRRFDVTNVRGTEGALTFR